MTTVFWVHVRWCCLVALWSVLVGGVGCSVEFAIPSDVRVTCSDDAPCSAGLICSREHQVCVQEEPICGNNVVEFPEVCDDGFRDACGSCNATCKAAGTGAVCGDGERCPEFETCDDGNTTTETCLYGQAQCLICSSECDAEPGLVVGCGDGVVHQGANVPDYEFEVCDDAEAPKLCADISPVFAGGSALCMDCQGWDTSGCEVESASADRMVSVPEGRFPRGCSEVSDPIGCDDDELPLRQIELSAFAVDTYEVTVERYAECVVAGGCTARELDVSPELCNWAPGITERMLQEAPDLGALRRLDHPLNCINWYDAQAYCQWAGKRLPTEAEWEKAAKGTSVRSYPWGNSPLPSCIYAAMADNSGDEGCGTFGTLPVGSKPEGVSPYGAHDMIGNVSEWVQDWYDSEFFDSSVDPDPSGPEGSRALLYNVVKGGAWDDDDLEVLRIPYRNNYNGRSARDFVLGFRCVLGPTL